MAVIAPAVIHGLIPPGNLGSDEAGDCRQASLAAASFSTINCCSSPPIRCPVMASHGVPRVTADEEKSEKTKQKEQQRIAQYRELADQVNTKIFNHEYGLDVLALTSKLLTQNPEYYTIWNNRRRILEAQFDASKQDADAESSESPLAAHETTSNLIVGDLQFLVPLMIKFPKCYWMWNHRIWLLNETIKRLPVPAARGFWQQELGLASKMLGKDSRNFHGWDYRRQLVSRLESPELSGTGEGTSMVEGEFAYTSKMIRSNLSNFSAWHYRSKLIPRLLDERQAEDAARRAMLSSEFKQIQEALYTDPGDQSLWKYHQFLMATVRPDSQVASIIQGPTNHDRIDVYKREINNIREMIDPDEDCKWIYQSLLQYTSEYLQLDAGTKLVTTAELRTWLNELRKLDPLREGRWDDLEKRLDL